MSNWEIMLKNQSAKEYIDKYIKELQDQFIGMIREQNPTVDERVIIQEAKKELVAYVQQVVFEGKQIPIPNITEFRGDKNVG